MDGKQQNNRENPSSDRKAQSEALQELSRGSEPFTVENETGDQGTERLMEEILDRENLKTALRAVLKNKGAPGIDGMTVDDLPGYPALSLALPNRYFAALGLPSLARHPQLH